MFIIINLCVSTPKISVRVKYMPHQSLFWGQCEVVGPCVRPGYTLPRTNGRLNLAAVDVVGDQNAIEWLLFSSTHAERNAERSAAGDSVLGPLPPPWLAGGRGQQSAGCHACLASGPRTEGTRAAARRARPMRDSMP